MTETTAAGGGTFPHEMRADNPETKRRLDKLTNAFREYYGEGTLSFFSAPGRCEVCGNHTDHNRGMVLAAAVHADVLAAAATRDGDVIRIRSEGFPEDAVSLSDAERPDPADFFTSRALIAGTLYAFRRNGYAVGGFDAVTQSEVPVGSGMSSSAAFEVLIGTVLNHLYNGGRIPPEKIAQMAQEAENVFFGKPCGLMDQMASAVGGLLSIDFADPSLPRVTRLPYLPEKAGLVLCLTATGDSHADLNEDYAAVPREMKAAAAYFGAEVLRDVPEETFRSAIPRLRAKLGDRAVLRSLHFYGENRRVARLSAALSRQTAEATEIFLETLKESGRSSSALLQNIYAPSQPSAQAISIALALSEDLLEGKGGTFRVHGGGFAGSILAFVPEEFADTYRNEMNRVFGPGASRMLRIRPVGAARLEGYGQET